MGYLTAHLMNQKLFLEVVVLKKTHLVLSVLSAGGAMLGLQPIQREG